MAESLEGLVSDTVLALEWDVIDHVGIGFGYNYFYMDTDIDRTHLSMSSKYEYHAVLLYAHVFF